MFNINILIIKNSRLNFELSSSTFLKTNPLINLKLKKKFSFGKQKFISLQEHKKYGTKKS